MASLQKFCVEKDAIPSLNDSGEENSIVDNVTDNDARPLNQNSAAPACNNGNLMSQGINIINGTNIHIGNNITYNISKSKNKKKKKNKELSIPDEIYGNDDEVSMEHFKFVSENCSKRWRSLGRELGFLDGELDGFEIDYDNYIGETVYQMLRTWSDRNEEIDKTIGKLATALKEAKCDECLFNFYNKFFCNK